MVFQDRLKNPVDLDMDRHQILAMRKKFLAINQKRLERARDNLEHKQKIVVDILPLLFHVNHPMLPGYVSQQTPTGLSNFSPTKEQLQQIKLFSRSFRYRRLKQHNDSIAALFVMGSIGSMGQSRASDLDIWVCHNPALDRTQLDELTQKCDAICSWAKEFHLDLCFFPMNAEAFITGDTSALSEDSSGSTQHYLLLDEFYRSAIYLGGRLPLWWFVPSQHEHHYDLYCHTLLERKFVRESEVINLGKLDKIPDEEFFSAAIWQFYKAIRSPYKSVLKLVLLEVYAHQHPTATLLAHQFKQKIESGITNIDELDPYLMLLQGLEQYLQSQPSNKRLDLVRRCFYLKVDRKLSSASQIQSALWQRQLLQTQVNRWGWSQQQLDVLDHRKQWKTNQVVIERQQLVSELLNSYRTLSAQFNHSSVQSVKTQAEVSLLGRQLYAAFERKSGKVEWINPDISPDISETHLLFTHASDVANKKQWRLYPFHNTAGADPQQRLKSSPDVTQLMVWAYCNQIYTARTNAILRTHDNQEYSLKQLLHSLEHWCPLPLPTPAQDRFSRKPYPCAIWIALNVESILEPAVTQTSGVLDPFNVGSPCESLINDAHMAIVNSWNEVIVHSLNQQSFESLVTELLSLLAQAPKDSRPLITIFCREANHAKQITTRTENLLSQLTTRYHQAPQTRLVVQHQGVLHCWQGAQHPVAHHSFTHTTDLVAFLGRPQEHLSAIFIEPLTLATHPLSAMCQLPTSHAIQVGYHVNGATATVYVLDEKGSLFTDQLAFRDEASLLRPLHQFIRGVINRLCLTDDGIDMFGVYPVEFYRITRSHTSNKWINERRDITTNINHLDFFNIQVMVHGDIENDPQTSIYCDDQEFHSLDFGCKLYKRVVSYIVARRQNAQRYPCYITDLDLSPSQASQNPLQLSHYLRIKSQLEQQLNQALEAL